MYFNSQIDILHPSAAVDFTKYNYSAVFASTLTTVTINGVSVAIPPSVIIPITIRSISNSATVFCLGTTVCSLTPPTTL